MMHGGILRHIVEAVPATSQFNVRPLPSGARVWLVNVEGPLSAQIGMSFQQRGAVVVSVPTGASPNKLAELLRCGVPEVVVDAGAGPDAGPRTQWRPAFRTTLAVLHTLYPAWASITAYGSLRYTALTWTQETTSAPADLHGLWSGLAKTLPREIAAVIPQVVCLDGPMEAGSRVIKAMEHFPWQELILQRGRPPLTLLPVPQHVDTHRSDRITAQDTVLVTGGARGIGWRLACALAARTGCRVMVSGREDVDGCAQKAWARLTDAQFEEYRVRAFTQDRDDEPLEFIRRRIKKQLQIRQILSHLADARKQGLRIDYTVLDVTNPDSVRRVIQAAGMDLSVVLHNAGVDMPARIPDKDPGRAEAVIGVKLDGFRNLVAALADRKLKVLCLTGSLTGRYGGMVGQIDYAAANESLAYASRGAQLPYPVLCLAWPTWDGVGLITNLKAASAYMRPINADEGVRAWIAELQGGAGGESAFMGDFAVVSCQHLESIPVPSDWEGAGTMLTRRHWLGRVLEIGPSRRIRSVHSFNPGLVPYAVSARVSNQPAVPITFVLEMLIHSMDGFQGVVPAVPRLEDVQISISGLREGAKEADPVGSVQFERIAEVVELGERAVLQVRVLHHGLHGPVELGSARVSCGISPHRSERAANALGTQYALLPHRTDQPGASVGARIYTWGDCPSSSDELLAQQMAEATIVTERWSPRLGYSAPIPPQTALPTSALEYLFSAWCAQGTEQLAVGVLLFPGDPGLDVASTAGAGASWSIASGRSGQTWQVKNLRSLGGCANNFVVREPPEETGKAVDAQDLLQLKIRGTSHV